MTATEALEQARIAGIQVRIDGDDLVLEASAALPTLRSVPRASCESCKHRTKFGNCGQPVRAGLSEQFELIAHPAGGKDCERLRDVQAPLAI